MDPADIEKEESRRGQSGPKSQPNGEGDGLSVGAESCLYRKRVEDGISPADNMKTQTLSARIRKSLSDEHGHGHQSLDYIFVIAPNYLLEKRTIAAYFRKT